VSRYRYICQDRVFPFLVSRCFAVVCVCARADVESKAIVKSKGRGLKKCSKRQSLGFHLFFSEKKRSNGFCTTNHMRSLFPLPLLLVFFFVLVVLVVVVLASAEDESSRKTALLSNFQGRAACFYEQRVAFPRNEAELKTILSRAEVKVVKAVSANAHSWNEKFWCGRTEEDEDEESIVNVFVNDLRVVGSGERRAHLFKGGFEKKYVSVDAGMKVRSMLEYIAEHGYALKSVPWFIDQTVGGAFAKLKF
jgi:hypothetical protein